MTLLHRKLIDSTGSPLSIKTSANWNTSDVATTSFPVTLPSSIVSGNLLLMFFSRHNSDDNIVHTGWTRLAGDTDSTEMKLILARIADGSEGATATFTSAATSGRASANTYCISGNRNGVTSSEIAVSTVVDSVGTQTTGNPPNLTPSWGAAENLWFGVTFIVDSNIGAFVSYPTNYSLGQITNINGNGSNGQAIINAARLLNASSEDPGPFTWTTARRNYSYTVAVRPQ